jgi:hypothetical protein
MTTSGQGDSLGICRIRKGSEIALIEALNWTWIQRVDGLCIGIGVEMIDRTGNWPVDHGGMMMRNVYVQ